MYDPDSGGKYYFHRQSGEKEWVAGVAAQLERVQGAAAGGAPPFMGVEKMEKPPPPTLEEYLQKMFLDHGERSNKKEKAVPHG